MILFYIIYIFKNILIIYDKKFKVCYNIIIKMNENVYK